MASKNFYTQYIIGRNFVKQTNYERINTGRRRKAKASQNQPIPMTAQELDTAYQYRQRAKREKLLRLADVNFEAGACVFATLTFRENLKDYDMAVKAFKGFTKKLRRKLKEVRYIATLEIQKRGAYHFHLLLNAPDIQFALDNIAPLWENGIVDIQPVTDVRKVIIYMTKDLIAQGRSHPLFNKRCYFVSQGMTRCIEANTWNGPNAQVQAVQKMLQGRTPDKRNQVNNTEAGLAEYADYYFPTNLYAIPQTAKLHQF